MVCLTNLGHKRIHPELITLMKEGRHKKLLSLLEDFDIKNARDNKGSTLLHLSAEHGTKYLTNYLIKGAQIDINVMNPAGETPLIAATREAKVGQVKILLEAGADMCIKANVAGSVSALSLAECHRTNEVLHNVFVHYIKKTCKSNEEIAALLVKAGCKVYRFSAFQNAEITRLMLERGSAVNVRDPQIYGNTPLHAAIELNDWETVKVLLEFGADKNIQNDIGWVPFLHAFHLKVTDLKLLELLWPDYYNWSDTNKVSKKLNLHDIFVRGTKELLEWFLQHCVVDFEATDDDNGHNLLHYLVKNPHKDIWQLFESAEFDVDVQNDYGMTALHLSGILVNYEAMEFLLNRGADVNVLDDVGRSALLNVFLNKVTLCNLQATKHLKCIELLLFSGSNLQIVDRSNSTIIMQLKNFYSHDIVVTVLSHFAWLEAIQSPIIHVISSQIKSDDKLRKIYEDAKIELESLKRKKIYGEMTYFDLLTMHGAAVNRLAENEDVWSNLPREETKTYYERLFHKRISIAKHVRKRRMEISSKKPFTWIKPASFQRF